MISRILRPFALFAVALFAASPATLSAADDPLILREIVPPELAAVPADAIGFWQFSVADAWKLARFEELAKKYHPEGKNLLEEIERESSIDPKNVDKVLFVFLKPGEEGRSESFVMLIRTFKAYDQAKLREKLFGNRNGVEEIEIANKTIVTGGFFAAHFVSPTLYAIGDKNSLERYCKSDFGKPAGFLKELRQLAQKKTYVFVGGADLTPLAEFVPFVQQQLPPPMQPLTKVKNGYLTVSTGDATKVEAQVSFAAGDEAKAAQETVEMGRTLAVQKLPEVIKLLKKELVQSPDPPEATYRLLQQGAALLKSAQLQVQGNTLSGKVTLPVDAHAAASIFMESIFVTEGQSRMMFSSIANDLNGDEAPKEVRPKSLKAIRKIAAAIKKYEAEHGHLPPQAIYSKDGKPLLSWRVLLLPYLGEEELYKRFKLDEPWHSDHNRPLLGQVPEWLKTSWRGHTAFRMIGGEKTPYAKAKPRKSDFQANQTLLVVEARRQVEWTRPETLRFRGEWPLPDLGLDAGFGTTANANDEVAKLQEKAKNTFYAVYGDGSVRLVSKKLKEETLRALIRAGEGKDVPVEKLGEAK